ncbi:leucine-rich repeat domain-containing protein [Prevotella sp. AM42-24]|uniref:leucine-rich repeat domain-containing protein n=1 Tax=Prevotella sp. AM42-24 TaxID=2293125 RepID=UPI000E4DD77D|nr:leucine-rich repeat domain-containing protein [Prevotella sp. AM42-24]RGH33652.1 leucine-rich repeat domain-containing protein [Prevotella sp. AM42-24]
MNKSKCLFMRLVLIIGLIVQCALLQASTLIDGLYYDLDTSNRTATVTYEVDGTGNYASLSANVKIPENVVYNGVTFTVTKIGENTFSNCKVLESISIPGTVLQIGQNTGVSNLPFYNCTSLKSVRFEDGASSLVLGSYYRDDRGYNGTGLFSFCPLEEVYIGRNITYIDGRYPFEKYPQYYGYSAFYNQPKLAKVTISSTVTEIPSCFLKGCKALNKVSIQGQLIKIPSYSFDGCQLSVLTLSNSIEEIGDYAFQNNTTLTTASLGDNVKKIGKYAFSGCTNLSILNLGNSLVTIDDYAFQSTSNPQPPS